MAAAKGKGESAPDPDSSRDPGADPAPSGEPMSSERRDKTTQQVLGYLNFSSGVADPQYLGALNELFRETPHWQQVVETLNSSLDRLEKESSAFSDATQARRVLQLVPKFIERYFEHHTELLAHQDDAKICNSFFLGRATEILLATDAAAGSDSAGDSSDSDPSDPDVAVLKKAIRQFNDYIGYRPVAVLESQKIEPYPNEWIRPTPIYIREAGFAAGDYEAVTRIAIELIESTDPSLLRAAYFDPSRLQEIAIDPRAYDFDHPANKRPNHHFGLWDPHKIDGDGYYTRFVVQQVNIDSLMQRVQIAAAEGSEQLAELEYEAAAVLAGTILMSSGISGYGPETHASTVSLGGLLAQIAAYRDEFYRQLIMKLKGSHSARLVAEAKRLQQPFAAARQDLNRRLTESRAIQLQRVQLARIYARMRYSEDAKSQAGHIQVPSARIATQIDCSLSAARMAIERGQLENALHEIESAREAMLRGIQCGACVDPWNILGFDANFSLFGPIENSLRDYRIDDLVDVIEETHELYAQLWSKAAATQEEALVRRTREQFYESANWWHQFAAHELESVEAEDPLEVFEAAQNVAHALEAWHQEGEATGDIGFWSPHVQKFDSCRAYWLVVNTLLARDDKVASLGLLMHWLSRSDMIPLEHGETSFFRLSLRWLEATLAETGTEEAIGSNADPAKRAGWKRIRRFFDYLEANAGEFFEVPEFQPDEVSGNDAGRKGREQSTTDEVDDADGYPNEYESDEFEGDFPDPFDDENEDDDRFSAAYESVVYRDSTDDGIDGSVFEFDSHDEDYLQQASRPIASRLIFIEQLSLVWRLVAVTWSTAKASKQPDALDPNIAESIEDLLSSARSQFTRISRDLKRLALAVANYKLSRVGADTDAMVNYDRLRLLRDSLVDQVMNASVSVTASLRFLTAASDLDIRSETTAETSSESSAEQETASKEAKPEVSSNKDELAAIRVLRACLLSDAKTAAQSWPALRASLTGRPILYVPLNRGGPPREIMNVRSRQHFIQDLLFWLPRLGLLKETYQLLELIREMELTPVGMGAITEFDDLFEVGCRAIVSSLIDAYENNPGADADDWLVANLEEVMEPLLRSWLAHSRTLRLSILEQVMDDEDWESIAQFIREYGRDLFTQRFLNLGNLRGILHQGVETWLQMIEEREESDYQTILDALENGADRKEFVDRLTFVLEAIVENYSEYRDYNSTTTQSDRGDLLYTLLDFLRLRVSYDRVVWNLRPVVLAHQVLANRGCEETAARWRQSLNERIQAEAKRHMQRLQELQKKYAMQLPSISKRIGEKFMRPLMIDYLCALIEPAMFHEDEGARESAIERIRQQAETFMQEPSGAGLDVPTWLLMMEDTIRGVTDKHEASLQRLLETYMLPPVEMTSEEVQSSLRSWETKLLERADEDEEVDEEE